MSEPFLIVLFVFCVYLAAGTIKGTLGIGLPTTALTLMTFFLSPFQALAINLVPMLITNIWQFSRSQNLVLLITRYAYFALGLSVSIFAVSFVTAQLSSNEVRIAVAIAVIIFALYNLFQRPFVLSLAHDKAWQLFFGVLAGIMGALTSMWAVPLVMYLLSRNLSPKEFVDAAGFLLLVGCVPLSIGYISTGLVTWDVFWPALAGTIGSLTGFQIGAQLRHFIKAEIFKKVLLWFFLIMGIRMAIVALSAL